MPRQPYRPPRDWLKDGQDRLFGKRHADDLDWRTPKTPLETALVSAAQRQNNLVILIRRDMHYDYATKALAEFADLHPETLRDVFNGSKHMSLPVLHALTHGMNLELTITSRKTDPRPPRRPTAAPDQTPPI